MGTTIWIFTVGDDDKIKRFPLTRYLRLIGGDPNERLPQYANRRVQFVEAGLKLEQRKPVDILRLLYYIVYFDDQGHVDTSEKENEWHLHAEMHPLFPEKKSGPIVDARHRFAKKRFYHRYRWEPTQEIEAVIVRAIFKPS